MTSAGLALNVAGHISEVVLHRARLVLGWVTVRVHIVLICNQPLIPTQPATLCDMENEQECVRGQHCRGQGQSQ